MQLTPIQVTLVILLHVNTSRYDGQTAAVATIPFYSVTQHRRRYLDTEKRARALRHNPPLYESGKCRQPRRHKEKANHIQLV